MNTVHWPLSWAVIIFIGAVLLLVIWWVISEYGASKYVQGRDNALQGRESWRRQIEGHKQMANAAWARSFTWYQEVVKLNKAQRRLHRKLARFEDVDDPRSPWHNVWERGYLSGWRDCLNEYGKTWQQVQAQAPQQAVEQGSPRQGQEQGVTLRPARDPASAPPEKVQGQEEGQAHDHG